MPRKIIVPKRKSSFHLVIVLSAVVIATFAVTVILKEGVAPNPLLIRSGMTSKTTTGQPTAPKPDQIIHINEQYNKYINNKYGFSFEYPADLELITDDDYIRLEREYIPYENYDNNFFMSLKLFKSAYVEDLESIVYTTYCNPNQIDTSANEFTKQIFASCTDLFEKTKAQYSIGQIIGIRGFYNPFESESSITLFQHNQDIYAVNILTGETGSPVSPTGINTLDQILASFKFF